MALLEMREAAFEIRGAAVLAPTTISLDEGEQLAHACATERSATLVAMIAAGIVRPSSGSIFIGAFDPRIQPVQVKRITGYVPHEAVPHEFSSFTRYVEYRACLWGLPRAQTVVRARRLLERLEGVHEAFAYPLVGALLAQPRLLVLDRPQAAYAAQIVDAAVECAILSTHSSQHDAQRFLAAFAGETMIRGAATVAIVTTRLRKELRILLAASAALALCSRICSATTTRPHSLPVRWCLVRSSALRRRCSSAAQGVFANLNFANRVRRCTAGSWLVRPRWFHASSSRFLFSPIPASRRSTDISRSSRSRFPSARHTRQRSWHCRRRCEPDLRACSMSCSRARLPAAAFALAQWRFSAALVFCVVSSFIAVRQYGESLARYDPL